jgi:hypothetical protein
LAEAEEVRAAKAHLIKAKARVNSVDVPRHRSRESKGSISFPFDSGKGYNDVTPEQWSSPPWDSNMMSNVGVDTIPELSGVNNTSLDSFELPKD